MCPWFISSILHLTRKSVSDVCLGDGLDVRLYNLMSLRIQFYFLCLDDALNMVLETPKDYKNDNLSTPICINIPLCSTCKSQRNRDQVKTSEETSRDTWHSAFFSPTSAQPPGPLIHTTFLTSPG